MKSRTLIPLLLDLELLRQVLFLLPLDLRSDGTIVHEVTRVIDLRLVDISLLKNLILEVFVGLEDEGKLEAGFLCGLEVREANVDKVLEGASIAVSDELRDTDVIAQGREPELRNRRSLRTIALGFGQRGIILVLLLLSLFALLDFLIARWLSTRDDVVPAIVERFGQAKVLLSRQTVEQSVKGKGKNTKAADR